MFGVSVFTTGGVSILHTYTHLPHTHTHTHTHTQLLLVVADVCQEDGESCVDKLPNHEHGFAMFETKHTKQAEEKAFLCSLHNPLVAGGILPLFHPLLSPHLHLKTNGAVLSIVQP